MDKNTFLTELQKRLKGLPEEDLQRTLEYYREMIEDRMEEGLSEEEAVAEIGPVEEIAEPLLPQTVRRKMKAWEIVLLILGFPVWFPLLIAAAAVIISLVATIYAVDVSLAAGGVGGVLCTLAYLAQRNWAGAAFILGCGLVCGGLAILCFMGSNALMKMCVDAVKKSIRRGKGL